MLGGRWLWWLKRCSWNWGCIRARQNALESAKPTPGQAQPRIIRAEHDHPYASSLLIQGKRDDRKNNAPLLVMGPALPARHQPGADSGMCRQSCHGSLFGLEHRLKMLCKSATHCRRGQPGVGLHLEHGSPEIPGKLQTLCRPIRWHAEYLPSGVGGVQKSIARHLGPTANAEQKPTMPQVIMSGRPPAAPKRSNPAC